MENWYAIWCVQREKHGELLREAARARRGQAMHRPVRQARQLQRGWPELSRRVLKTDEPALACSACTPALTSNS